MKAVRFHEQGDVDVLRYEDAPDPHSGPGEVVIRVRACALNRLDIWVRQTLPGVPLPHIGGSDIAGEIVRVGEEVHGVFVGDRVLVYPGITCGTCEYCLGGQENICRDFRIVGFQTDGGYAEFTAVPARNLIPIPEDLCFEDAAAFPLVFLTAWHMLISRAALRAGEDVLIQAGGSGIGSAAIQIAKLAGARVIATAGSDAKVARARELGADVAVNYTTQDFHQVVREVTADAGVDVVFEHVGPATWENSVKSLARNGRLVFCGATTGPSVTLELRPFYAKQLSVLGSMLGTRRELLRITQLVARGLLRPVIDRTFGLAEAAQAQEVMESRDHFGKLILVP